jgi:ferredoxin
MSTKPRKRHTPGEVVRKLRDADTMLRGSKDLAAVLQASEVGDCDACRSECPVEAISPDSEVPAEWSSYIQLNADMAAQCPPITEQKPPLATG